MILRTRALPARARRFDPLSSGDPVNPAYGATALRSRKLRDKICINCSAASTPRPIIRTSRRTMAFWFPSRASRIAQPLLYNKSDLFVNNPQKLYVTPKSRYSVGLQRHTLRCTDGIQGENLPATLAQGGIHLCML